MCSSFCLVWMRFLFILSAFCFELQASFQTCGVLRNNFRVKRYLSATSSSVSGGLFPLLTTHFLPPSEQVVKENYIAILEQFVDSLSTSTSNNDLHYNWNHPQDDIETLSWAVSVLSSKDQQPVLHVSMHNIHVYVSVSGTMFATPSRKRAVTELLSRPGGKKAALLLPVLRGCTESVERSDLEDLCT